MIGTLRATERKDLPALAKFLVRVYNLDPSDFHVDPQLLEWKYLCPRAGWEGGRSYLLERDGQIVAHGGICPVTFRLPSGETVSSLTVMDWAADRSTPGVGMKLLHDLIGMTPTSFIIGGAPVTRKIIPRIGFRHAEDAATYAAWLRPWREFRTRPRDGRSVLRLLHGLAHPVRNRREPGQHWDSVPVNGFDESLQPILSANRPWTSCQRTLADLNYLLKCPHLETQGFVLKRQGRLAGYFIMGKCRWEARLLDIVVDSAVANDWKLACAAVTTVIQRDPEVCRIRTFGTMPILSQALAWNGYWCQYQEPIAVYDPTGMLSQAFPVGFQLCDGDSGY